MNTVKLPGFRKMPQTGVIYVMQKAAEKGFRPGDLSWANLGQGAPETGSLEGAPPRIQNIKIDTALHEYGPVAGHKALREKVAELYNRRYRQERTSQYTWENVCISGGGRIALTRIAASLGNINMGHFLPDYTAYEELLSVFKAFIPIPILLSTETHYQLSFDKIKKEILGRGLQAILLSNPCNPTGQLIQGDLLRKLVRIARPYSCSLIFDEFYSHYIYPTQPQAFTVSAAEHVEDVNRDPIIIIDGLTKNWRYPGWRISWTLGPKDIIQSLSSAGSFLDGGASSILQNEALPLLEKNYVEKETQALQQCFEKKRLYAIDRLQKMGITIEALPQGTFYIWANLSSLPDPLKDGLNFFEAGLEDKVITVPGIFFDVNPEKRRKIARFQKYTRISFGPNQEELKRGLDALEHVIKKQL